MLQSAENKILKRIRGKGRGCVVFQQDFADCGTPMAIKSAFHRIYKAGIIVRLSQGIYYYPKEDNDLGVGILYPSLEQVAEAIAKRDNAKIIPTGAQVLNKIGLSPQVPTNLVYLTSGSPRRIKIGKGNGILFKHSSSGKLFSFKSEIMMLVMMAMKEIGPKDIKEEHLETMCRHIAQVPQQDFCHDIKLMPTWIRQILMKR